MNYLLDSEILQTIYIHFFFARCAQFNSATNSWAMITNMTTIHYGSPGMGVRLA
jgi:hypothetical protein